MIYIIYQLCQIRSMQSYVCLVSRTAISASSIPMENNHNGVSNGPNLNLTLQRINLFTYVKYEAKQDRSKQSQQPGNVILGVHGKDAVQKAEQPDHRCRNQHRSVKTQPGKVQSDPVSKILAHQPERLLLIPAARPSPLGVQQL